MSQKTRCSNPVRAHECIGYMCPVCEDTDQWATIERLKAERDASARDLAALRAAVERLLTKPATVEGLDPEATRLMEGALRQMQDYLRAALSSPGDGHKETT